MVADMTISRTAPFTQPSGSGAPPLSFNYTYNPANQRTNLSLADSSYWVYKYDNLGQVTNACKYWRDGTRARPVRYEYDSVLLRLCTQKPARRSILRWFDGQSAGTLSAARSGRSRFNAESSAIGIEAVRHNLWVIWD